jgi:hypothetical protein
MKDELTLWQHAALAPPHDLEIADELRSAYRHLLAKGGNVMLACDIGIEIAQTFGWAGITNIGVVAYINTATPPGAAVFLRL